MLSETDRQNLLRNLGLGRVVLVTGAGFSHDAKNVAGMYLPDSVTLSKALWEFLYKSTYDGKTTLRALYEAAQTHPAGLTSLRQFLFEQLHVVDWPDWYQTITRWFWHRIYTFNVDDLLEHIYIRAASPILQPIIAPDHYHERDQFLRNLQLIKLHGSITDNDKRRLTFGYGDYGSRGAERIDVWYQHFVQDYATLPTIFVGTTLDEPLFWEYLKLRGEQRPGEPRPRRPKCFLIAREISRPNAEVLERYNIIAVRATGREFFEWLNQHTPAPSREQVLRAIDPSLEIALSASEHGKPQAEVKLAEGFYSFFRAPHRPINPRARPAFLLGSPPTWEDIATQVDAHRDINDLLKQHLEAGLRGAEPNMFVLTSAAGGGKSTIAKRVAIELIDEGFPILFSDGDQRPNPEALAAYALGFQQRMLYVFDNAGHDLHLIAEFWERLSKAAFKPVLLVVARSNDVANRGYQLAETSPRSDIAVPHLSDTDIRWILETLTRNDVLGDLRGRTPREQFDVFKKKARKQILVAMREATSGLGFDEILRDEFAKVEPAEARLLYLVVALASTGDYGLSLQQMITAMQIPPNQTQLLAEKSLSGILVQKESQPDRHMIRHPAIAEFILDAAPRDLLATAVVGFLRSVASVLPVGRARRWSLVFRVYRETINHRRLFALFPGRVELIRDIYEQIKEYYRDDGHYWLQYGSFELEYGAALDAAENVINQAAAILPSQQRQVETATAYLKMRKSLAAPNSAVAVPLMEDAVGTLRFQMSEKSGVAVHPFHIFGSQMMAYIGRWVSPDDRSPEFRRVHDELKRTIPSHLSSHPDLRSLIDALKRAELETVIR